MKRRTLSLLLALAMCLGLVGPVSAAETVGGTGAPDQDALTLEQEPAVPFAAPLADTQRQIINFNKDWRFEEGENKGAAATEFDDSGWRMLNLPHDYSIENDFDPESPAKSGGGYLDGGPAWYRKTWVIPESMAGKRISIDFGGVYMNSKVYVNGTLVGNYPYGYSPFSYDITDLVVADGMTENVMAVYTNNQQPSSRWYSGSGIYRDVQLTVTEPIHVARYGTYVTTPDLEAEFTAGNPVSVSVDTEVENESGASANVTVTHTIYNKGSLERPGSDTPVATVTTDSVTVASGETAKVPATLKVSDPTLWQVGVGGMYMVHTEVKTGGVTVDTYDTDFGFRWLDFTGEGFFINGRYTKMRGVCQHHDQGALGAVNNQTALDRQIRILRESGVNAIRSSHNPASRALLNACNEQGIMVMNEAFDTWYGGKNEYDFAQFFDLPCTHPDAEPGQTWQEFDIKNMVEDAKNDPAVIMWSIGNEIGEAWDAKGRETGMKLAKWVREVDDSGRAVTQADPLFGDINPWYFDPANNSDHWQLIDNNDATGFNYGRYDDKGYDKAHELNPDWFVYSSETSSAVATRGEYYHPWKDDDSHAGDASHGGRDQCSEFDNDRVAWGTTLHYALKEDAKRKYLGGVFFWTGFDYLGEPAPFAGKDEAKSSYFGFIDTCGFPKDSFYLLQSQWLDVATDPMVHILPHWNWEGDNSIQVNAEGGQGKGYTPIRIYSNAPSVEIFLNGKSLGRKDFVQHPETDTGLAWQSDDSSQENLYLQWNVPYEAGTVVAKAYDRPAAEGGKVIATDTKVTAGAPAALKMAPEAESRVITADGEDLAYIVVDVVDKNGVFHPQADIPVSFSISGNGRIVGTDNGNPLDWTNMKSTQRSTFNGKALVIVQSTTNAGSFTVTASAAGLPLASTTVYTTAPDVDENTLLGYDAVSVKTLVNEQPALPATVTARYADATALDKAVSWNEIPAESLAKAGYITVTGTVTEARIGATATAVVEVVAPVGVRPVSVVTQPGVQPALPGKVFLISSDGSATEFPVTWAAVDSGDLTDGNEFDVAGTLENSDFDVTAHVRVAAPEPISNIALASKGFAAFNALFISPYDPIAHINDGIISYNTSPKNGWGSWHGMGTGKDPAETHWLECDLAEAVPLDNISFYFREDDGIYVPKEIVIQYWNELEWVPVENQSKTTGAVGGQKETITFDSVTTDKIRAVFTRGDQTGDDGSAPGKKVKDCVVITEVEIETVVPERGNNVASLTTLMVNGEEVEGFSPTKTAYTVKLSFGAEIPEVTATAAANGTVMVIPAISNSSVATVQVTSEDGSTTKDYTIQFVAVPGVTSATLTLDVSDLKEDDIATIHVNAVLENGSTLDEDLFTVKYSVPDAGSPAKAEVKNGKLYAYTEGTVTLNAEIFYLGKATSAQPLSVTIQAGSALKSVRSYAPVNVETSLGMAPNLPNVIKAQFDAGLARDMAVVWDEIDPSQYARYGSFVVNGTVEGQALRPVATVHVRAPIAVKNQSFATPLGIRPTLPAEVYVYASDGSTILSEVTWDAYDVEKLKTEQTFEITGTAELGELPVIASVRVVGVEETVQSENYAQLWTGFKYSLAFADYGQQGANMLNNGKVDKWCSWGGPDKETLNVGIVFGKDYPGLRYVDTVNLNVWNDNTMDKIGIKDCVVQAYVPEFTVDDIPGKPNNMLDPAMADHPLNNDANWVDVENLVLPEGFNYGDNIITFDMVQTYAIRLKLTKNGADGSDYYLSLGEIYAYGKSAVSKTEPVITAITVDGAPIAEFDMATKAYTVTVSDTTVPEVTAVAEGNSAVTVLPAPNIDGKTKILVTSEDGLKTETYTVAFESQISRYNVNVNGGVAYRAVRALAPEEIVEKYAEGEEVTVVADAAPNFQAFDKWVASGLTLTQEEAEQSIMTFAMPGGDVTLTATYKERELTDAEMIANAKAKIGSAVALPYGVYADENAMAEAATRAVQALVGNEVTALVRYENGVFILTFAKGDSGATVKPFDITVAAPPATGGGSSNTTTKTEKNPDGSTTKTVTDKKTGNVTETTTYPDGTKIVAVTPKDGKTSITVTVPSGKEKVTITIPTDKQPAPGEVAVILREDGKREIVKTSVSTQDGLRVTLAASCKLEIIDNSKEFSDAASDNWAADAIQFVASRELFNGTGDGFAPGGNMSRAMLFTVLARLDGQDLTGGETWYSPAMDWAKESGISDGTNPDANITRESLAVMLYRYAGSPQVGGMALGEFSDGDRISAWASDAMLWCVDSGILNGSGGKLNPAGTATRAEVAAMLQRFITAAK